LDENARFAGGLREGSLRIYGRAVAVENLEASVDSVLFSRSRVGRPFRGQPVESLLRRSNFDRALSRADGNTFLKRLIVHMAKR
jgi:hypothetical protein